MAVNVYALFRQTVPLVTLIVGVVNTVIVVTAVFDPTQPSELVPVTE